MEVAKLAAAPNLEVRFVSCNESAIKRWLSSELEETVFSLTHELFMTKHHAVTVIHTTKFLHIPVVAGNGQNDKQSSVHNINLTIFFFKREIILIWWIN